MTNVYKDTEGNDVVHWYEGVPSLQVICNEVIERSIIEGADPSGWNIPLFMKDYYMAIREYEDEWSGVYSPSKEDDPRTQELPEWPSPWF